jgi:hypothetical protein
MFVPNALSVLWMNVLSDVGITTLGRSALTALSLIRRLHLSGWPIWTLVGEVGWAGLIVGACGSLLRPTSCGGLGGRMIWISVRTKLRRGRTR